jgi:hypothetical protein
MSTPKLTFEQAKANIEKKYPNTLTLLEFTDRKLDAKFLDLEFGEFIGNFMRVRNGGKKHNDRAVFNLKNVDYKVRQTKIEETFLNKYGVTNPSKLPEITGKTKQTNLKRYGVVSSTQRPEVKEKSKQTNIDKLGVPYPMGNPEVKAKARITNYEYSERSYKIPLRQSNYI